ncbi:MAG: transcription elongation factor GreA [Myxococcales bacterium]|nr:transcription elongation factor GreA [Polyangiaceae bacterium]MDW8248828.1 transcription elongation factor GreA [Myxococcales bacterium]
MSEKIPMTPAGNARLREELQRLKEVERPRISKAIGEAREHGDLRENAEYHAAKEEQGMIEAKIRDYEAALSRAEIIDPSKLSGPRIAFGAKVRLVNADTEEEVLYQIVGPYEADLEKGLISVSAPLARALVGKEVGDEVTLHCPDGSKRNYEILDVSYGLRARLP